MIMKAERLGKQIRYLLFPYKIGENDTAEIITELHVNSI